MRMQRVHRGGPLLVAVLLLLLAACEGQPADEDEAAEDAAGEDDVADDDADDADDPDEPAEEDDEADDGDAFYASGDTLEMIISWSPGGGTDTIGRFMAPFLSEHIEGQPDVQVTNIEGGGGIQGHNEFELRREADGYTTLFSAGSSKVAYLLEEPGIEFAFEDWQPALGVPAGAVMYGNPDLGVEEAADLADPAEEIQFGSIGAASTDAVVLVGLDILEIDYNVIFGYEGSGDVRTAFERGEINFSRDGTIGYLGNVQPLEEEGEVIPLFTLGQVEGGELVRDAAFPDLPHLGEVYEDIHGEEPEGELWDTYVTMLSILFNLEKVLWFHEDAPAEAVEAVREAGVALMEDEDFRAEGEEIFGPYELIVGEDIEREVSETFESLDDETQRGFIEHLESEHDL